MRDVEWILALDLASRFGWAEGANGGKPNCGSKRCAIEGAGTPEIFGNYTKWLSQKLIDRTPDVLVYEAPLATIHVRGHTTVKVTRILFGLAAITEGIAYRMGVRSIREASVNEVRKHFIGVGNLPGNEAKRAVGVRCRQLGYEIDDHNAGDAAALWDYTASVRHAGHAVKATPLFQEK